MRKLTEFFLRRGKQKPEVENPGNIYIYKSKEQISTIIITTFDVNPDLLEEIIVTTKRRLPRKNDRLVYLTNNSDFTMFRRHGVIFEYLPPLIEQRLHATDMPWQAYLRGRWGLILAKWRPRRVLAYGTTIDTFLEAAPATTVRKAPDTLKS
ncbi:hypothetical protein [Mesorhizobium sp. M6A.T.Ce.TU.016.01.1.1]|uniref:hypothetical protein n=1 Tax=Mesorhizobium sp. M6A.T.Ce.TU.016.01.1.1 TaxID=2496783 RepID=UPI000FCCD7DA|nr:hypothetical protein [Mesorhizobium sp. M6A.T.Ce.TU.016.01.1.1]RUU25717.1 hypothetical protein EOC94_30150 [Mesorhizobium sp. M6A.T.Ce.TU.016.01.1.1]